MMREIDFPWEPEIWYHMKLRVAEEGEKAFVHGKVWKRGEEEPSDWSIAAEDPLPIDRGSPGLSAYSPTPVYFDNLKVTENR
jgi:hypothetical protein